MVVKEVDGEHIDAVACGDVGVAGVLSFAEEVQADDDEVQAYNPINAPKARERLRISSNSGIICSPS